MAQAFSHQVHSFLECPVCSMIPRSLPVLACAAGHVVCELCGPRLVQCPLCRKSLCGRNTNTIIGSIIEIAQHKCKFNIFNCGVEKPLNEIEAHEKECRERTIVCPFGACKKEVQLRKYEFHSLFNQCAIDLGKLT